MMNYIYFDAAASTKPSREVLECFNEVSTTYYANPSALHSAGFLAEKILHQSATTISNLIGVYQSVIYFTSGGTDSNNLALFGMALARPRTHRHIITHLGEHPSVTQVFKKLETDGFEVTWLKGLVTPEMVNGALRDDTALVSLVHVNNETGHINDIDSIAKAVKAKNKQTYFFSDGVQGFGKIPVSLHHIDAYSFSGHKIGAVKGVGGLYLSDKVRIIPQILGGGQQKNMRSGTENTASIAALAKAAELAFAAMDENREKVLAVKNELLKLESALENVHINGNFSSYILNISFLGVRSEVLLHALAESGLFASAGSACSSSKKYKDKNALHAFGFDRNIIESAIRFSFSSDNTPEEAARALDLICDRVNTLRKYTRK